MPSNLTSSQDAEQYVPLYWTHSGTYDALCESLCEQLVPPEGDAPTDVGQMLRWMSKIYYDIYNNGGCNLDMPFFKEGRQFLYSYRSRLKPVAAELGIGDFYAKLKAFVCGKGRGQDNDAVVDVIVVYASRNK